MFSLSWPTRQGYSTLSFFDLQYQCMASPTSPNKCSRSRGQGDKEIQRWVSLTFSIRAWLHQHPPRNVLALVAKETRRFNVDSPWPREDYDGGIGAAMQYNLRPTRHGDSTLSFFGLLYYSKSTPTSPFKCSRSRGQRDKDIQRWVSLTFSINTWLHLHPPIYNLALVANETRRSNVEYLWPSVSMHGFTYIPQ